MNQVALSGSRRSKAIAPSAPAPASAIPIQKIYFRSFFIGSGPILGNPTEHKTRSSTRECVSVPNKREPARDFVFALSGNSQPFAWRRPATVCTIRHRAGRGIHTGYGTVKQKGANRKAGLLATKPLDAGERWRFFGATRGAQHDTGAFMRSRDATGSGLCRYPFQLGEDVNW